MKRHRVAIFGAGTMGRRHARVLASIPRFEVVGVLDLDVGAAKSVGDEWGAPLLASEDEAFEVADAVVVATPIAAHAPMVMRALLARRHVLVEKPIAGYVQDARVLLGVAQRAGCRVLVGHSERFNPVVRALTRLVTPADVLAIELRRMGSIGGTAREHGALLNLGVHDLDLLAYLTRSTLTLRHAVSGGGSAGASASAGGSERNDTAHVLVRTGSGAAGHVYVDQRTRARHRTIALTTKRHVFNGDLLTARLASTCRATGVREEIALGTEEPLVLQAHAFADALDGNPSEIATGIDGARALLAAERAAAQMVATARRAPDSSAHAPTSPPDLAEPKASLS